MLHLVPFYAVSLLLPTSSYTSHHAIEHVIGQASTTNSGEITVSITESVSKLTTFTIGTAILPAKPSFLVTGTHTA